MKPFATKTLCLFLLAAAGLAGSAGADTNFFFHGFVAANKAPLTFDIDAFLGNQYPNEPVTVTPVGDPSLGTLKILAKGEATFKPGPGFSSQASFNYSYSNPESGAIPPVEIFTGVLTFVDFSIVKGSYVLVNDDSGAPWLPPTGTLTIAASGAATFRDGNLSGAVQFGKTGTFDHYFDYPEGFSLSIDLSTGTPVISGGFAFGSAHGIFGVDTTATKIVPAGANTGRYSVLMQPIPATAAGGTGWATMNVTAAGQISFTGQLNNGTAFSATSGVTAGGVFPLNIAYVLNGSATFRDTPGVSDFDGSFTQTEYDPQTLQEIQVPLPLSFIGSRFTPAGPKTHLLKYSKPTGTASLVFSSGDLTTPVTATATVALGDSATAVKAPLKALTIWAYDSPVFGTVGGIFSGQFQDPVAKAVRYFSGVTFQKQNIAVGVFRGAVAAGVNPTNYGTVTLTPE